MTNYEIYYQQSQFYVTMQDDRKRQLEFKASSALGLSAALIGLAGLAGAAWSGWLIVPVLLMGVGFLGSAVSSLLALQLQGYQQSPPLSALKKHIVNGEDEETVLNWVATSTDSSVDWNEKLLDRKAARLQWSLWFLALETVMLGFIVVGSKFDWASLKGLVSGFLGSE